MLTRFAPAPTGLLHLGHVANAIYVWGLAAREGAGVLLRIEDHDRQRSRASYEAALLDDLDWLGFVPNRFPTAAFRSGPCESRQSDRQAAYEEAVRDLASRGLVYGCRCSRPLIVGPGGIQTATRSRYPGTCRDLGLTPGAGMSWRVRIEPGVETFDDLVAGVHTQEPARDFGDPVIRDRHGNWSYQFAVAVDDFSQGIDLVIRGRDLLSSTGLQIHLARLLGRTAAPRFAHHSLIMKSASQKLSKSDGDTGIGALRAAGETPADVIGRAAWRVGLQATPAPVAAEHLASRLTWPPKTTPESF